jgi:hypothetical protein
LFVFLTYLCLLCYYYGKKPKDHVSDWIKGIEFMTRHLSAGEYLHKNLTGINSKSEDLFHLCLKLQKQGLPLLVSLGLLKEQCLAFESRAKKKEQILLGFFFHTGMVLGAAGLANLILKANTSMSPDSQWVTLNSFVQILAVIWLAGFLQAFTRKLRGDWFWDKGLSEKGKCWLETAFHQTQPKAGMDNLSAWVEDQNLRQNAGREFWLGNIGLIEFIVAGVPCLLILAPSALLFF